MYPSKNQEVLLAKTFGCVRYVYNRGLALKMAAYEKDKKGLSVFTVTTEMTKWKDCEETKWLSEVNSQALQMSLRFLDAAYTNFFKKRAAFPKFKSKHDNHQGFCNPQSTVVSWEDGKIFIPKFKGGIKTVLHRKFDGKIKSSFVSKTPSGKYFISVLVETNMDNPKYKKPKEDKTLGIDLGIKDFATFSNGETVKNPRHLKKQQKALKRAQRKLSRKKKGSKNREKQRKIVARKHEKVANSRKDFLHKVTANIVKSQDYTSIAIEDLDVADMLRKGKKNKLSRSIADAGWGMFRTFLTYKCERSGKNLLVIGRFEPSSKLCSCGFLNDSLTLKDREWDCPNCKTHHKRDELAAQNIKRFAFCKQNTKKDSPLENTRKNSALPNANKNLVSQELREPSRKTKTPFESDVSRSLKKEASTALA
jgi:putative transposase